MERLVLISSLIAIGAFAQTSVTLVTAVNGTASAGQVAGYSLDGVYSSDGTKLTFVTTLTFPVAQAVNGTVLQTYL